MPERRLLAFAYGFPPMTLAEAPLSAKRFANLPGWQTDVIAASSFGPGMGHDPHLAAYAEAGVRSVTRISPPRFPFGRLRLLSRIPDPLRYLNNRAVRAAGNLNIANFDAMLSWSNWCSSHLAALRIKRRHPGLPWAAHFSDPWVDNPFVMSGGVEFMINSYLERQVIENADRVLFTTPETVDLVMAKYPTALREKVRVIPHGYEPAMFSGQGPQPRGRRRLILRYLGNFYGPRSPEPLFGAIATILKQRPSLSDEICVEIVGQVQQPPTDTSAFRDLPTGLVVFKPAVDYHEFLRLMETADLLLVIDAPAKLSVFLPSKLVDYLGAGRPIVGLTPPGASDRVLREAGYPVADPRDIAASAAALQTGLDMLVRNQPEGATIRERYSAVATGAEMAAVLNDIAVRAA